jgi:chromate transport protein ChrA
MDAPASPLRAVGEDSSYASLSEAMWTWGRVALLSFGGPAGQIAVMHRILVEEKRWISERRLQAAMCCASTCFGGGLDRLSWVQGPW